MGQPKTRLALGSDESTFCDATGTLRACQVTVADTSAALGNGVDESYELQIDRRQDCTISAPTVWGAFRGMESLRQVRRRTPRWPRSWANFSLL